ncbi:hypothetical protein AUC70_05785 [Methyloceanibacter stevinii]|uniref:Uncharacterized protein n=1 Tax=Methyloceanibacter stevinii TaxID=1774970 RepID=A0A1E3VP91_9HYPH|nr:hypothetical protein [Methyloceanibacter stevinii]ODR95353.1 hypothetical protein AUC70_05785 [Methyloceanibacter stevinii]
MRALTHNELARMTRTELTAILHSIAALLPDLPEGSQELRIAHYNLRIVRTALAPKPGFGPR